MNKDRVGQDVKVLLPGERPWARVLDDSGDTFKGRIVNTLFRELSEQDQAKFLQREFGDSEPLPELHSFKRGDEIWFEKDREGSWVPVEDDPTPWCHFCHAMEQAGCDCGPIAANN